MLVADPVPKRLDEQRTEFDMSVSYLDTLAIIRDQEGLAYGKITKAMRVHVRSMVNDDLVRSFLEDGEQTTLDDPEGVIWFTTSGAEFVDLLTSSGLLAESAPAKPSPRKRSSRRRKTTKVTARRVVPTPSESVEPTNPLKPSNGVRRVPGNSVDEWQKAPVQESEADRIQALERKVSALMAALTA